MRYAIYYLPPPESALARSGTEWLGWDVHAGEEVERAAVAKPHWVASPRMYGFHGTLKPPFRLVDGRSEAELRKAVTRLAAMTKPVMLGNLELTEIGPFLALTAPDAANELNALAESCVRELDEFRAPASEEELARRRAAGVDETEDAYLERWGYPYVLDRFRFHITVTGALDKPERDEARGIGEMFFADALAQPASIDALSILSQPNKGAPFHEIARIALNKT